jgi:hypothetical protein
VEILWDPQGIFGWPLTGEAKYSQEIFSLSGMYTQLLAKRASATLDCLQKKLSKF